MSVDTALVLFFSNLLLAVVGISAVTSPRFRPAIIFFWAFMTLNSLLMVHRAVDEHKPRTYNVVINEGSR